MIEAAESVVTGEITQAVRDSNSDVGPIRTGDWIGIVRGDGIHTVADTAARAAIGLLGELLGDDVELLTLITGVDADPADTDSIKGWLADEHADVQVELHRGGQPLYPYLFGVE
jgi:dihydroxyacetone kinase-like predicted kinase